MMGITIDLVLGYELLLRPEVYSAGIAEKLFFCITQYGGVILL